MDDGDCATGAGAGATGAVGIAMRDCLEQLNFPFNECTFWAHPDEAGDEVVFADRSYKCQVVQEDSFDKVDIALFSAGGTRAVQGWW